METQPACLLAMGGKQPWAMAPTKKSLPLVMSGRKKVLSLRLWSGRLDILPLWPWGGSQDIPPLYLWNPLGSYCWFSSSLSPCAHAGLRAVALSLRLLPSPCRMLC